MKYNDSTSTTRHLYYYLVSYHKTWHSSDKFAFWLAAKYYSIFMYK